MTLSLLICLRRTRIFKSIINNVSRKKEGYIKETNNEIISNEKKEKDIIRRKIGNGITTSILIESSQHFLSFSTIVTMTKNMTKIIKIMIVKGIKLEYYSNAFNVSLFFSIIYTTTDG